MVTIQGDAVSCCCIMATYFPTQDDDMLEALVRLKVHTWRMDSGIVKHDLGWWV